MASMQHVRHSNGSNFTIGDTKMCFPLLARGTLITTLEIGALGMHFNFPESHERIKTFEVLGYKNAIIPKVSEMECEKDIKFENIIIQLILER